MTYTMDDRLNWARRNYPGEPVEELQTALVVGAAGNQKVCTFDMIDNLIRHDNEMPVMELLAEIPTPVDHLAQVLGVDRIQLRALRLKARYAWTASDHEIAGRLAAYTGEMIERLEAIRERLA